jgi:inner membrane protein
MQPSFAFFRWFAAYPAFLRSEIADAAGCVWFHDLRFVTPGRAGTPFQYGLCRESTGGWQPFQLLGGVRAQVY